MWKQHLRPYVGESAYDAEPFEEWFPRIAAAIPGVPRELAQHWLYENWGALQHNVAYLSLEHLTARRGTLTSPEALQVTVHEGWGAIKPGTAYLDAFVRRRDSLAVEMWQSGTWPKPIVVLDNEGSTVAPARQEIGRRHLLEGHRRLTFLHGLVAAGKAQETHAVWLVQCERPAHSTVPATDDDGLQAELRDVRLAFDDAVEVLAAGTGSIQDRLLSAFARLHDLDERDLGDQHEVWAEMLRSVERVQDRDLGSLVTSIRAMSNREACHRARTIVELSRWLVAQDRRHGEG